jgi:hypothetical protein
VLEWGDAMRAIGTGQVLKGVEILSKPLFSSSQFTGLPNTKTPPVKGNAPQIGSHAVTDQSKAIDAAVKAYDEEGRRIQLMDKLLGDSFDSTGADIDRITKLLVVFAEQGVDPATAGFGDLANTMTFLKNMTGPVNTALKDMNKTLASEIPLAAATGASSLDKLQIEANAVQKALSTILQKPDAENAAMAIAGLTLRLQGLKEAIDAQTKDQNFTASLREMGDTMREDVYFAALDSEDGLSRLQRQRQALSRAIQVGIANNKTEDKTFQDLVKRYKEVTAAINEQTDAMAVQAGAADFLAEALGVALQGGIHEAAAQKAKQTGIEALEWLVRAGAYALFGNPVGAAGALKAAAGFGAVAAAWGALAAVTPATGSGGAVAIPTSIAASTSNGDAISSARDTSSSAARDTAPPSQEVSIYLVGPGFNAMNPEVQRVVRGATQEAAERFGNATVRVVPHGA